MSQSVTILLTKSPYESQLTKEAYNVILSSSAFFDDINVIFYNKGLYQLHQQCSQSSFYKDLYKITQSFKWYDIEPLYVINLTEPDHINLTDCVYIDHEKAKEYMRQSAHCYIF